MKWTCNKKTAEVGKSLATIGIALIVGALFILLVDKSSIKAYSSLIQGALDTPQSIANTISKSIPLVFTGLAVAMGSQYDALDIDAESRLYAGAMASIITALTLSFFPASVLLVISTLAGILAGMAMNSVPGTFKVRFSTDKVIVAIMLNYICTLFTSYLVNGPYKTEGSMAQTELIAEGIWFGKPLPRIQLIVALFLLLLIAAAIYIFLWKTSVGYQLRAVRANPSAAGTAGIRVSLSLIIPMALNGDITALAGMAEVFRKYHRFIEGFLPSFGFTGIAVAILGRNRPAGVLLTTLLFGIMGISSLHMSRGTMVSINMIAVIQNLMVLLVAAPELIEWTRKRG